MNHTVPELEEKIEKIKQLDRKLHAAIVKKSRKISQLQIQVQTLQDRAYKLTDHRCLLLALIQRQGESSSGCIYDVNQKIKKQLNLDSD